MLDQQTSLLVVEDDPTLRTTLSALLENLGCQVRSVEDGFSALAELRKEIPKIILSDLNMPGMSGFEFLSVVRRRFPAVQIIAMSGAYSGEAVPAGVAADAFYEKGTSLTALLSLVKAMSRPERWQPLQRHGSTAPIWIPGDGIDPSRTKSVMLACPECLRIFSQIPEKDAKAVHEAGCVHCHSLVHYAIVQPNLLGSSQTFV